MTDKDGDRIVGGNVFTLLFYVNLIVSKEDAPKQAFMSFVFTTFKNSLEQLAKLGFGKVENMLSKCQDVTVSFSNCFKSSYFDCSFHNYSLFG